jgi:hypothetical protein
MDQNDDDEIYNYYSIKYYNNLEKKGVIKLTKKSGLGQALCCLIKNIGIPINISELKDYVQKKGIELSGGDPLQPRHLGIQKGYNILKGKDIHPITKEPIPKSHFLLLDLENCHPGFISKKRNVDINVNDWETLKLQYANSCVNCGSKEGEPMRWNSHAITTLQQGHMNPMKPLILGNIIPQCGFCNQQYKNKAIFNERGFVIDFNKQGFTQEPQ